MKNNKFILFTAVIILLAIIGYFVYNSLKKEDKTVNKEAITIGVFTKSMGNVPYYIAKDKGWFEKALGDKYRIEYMEYNDRPSIASALSSGSLQYIFSAEIPAILIKAQGVDIRFESLSATLTQEIIVRSSSSINHIKDLKGKKIAILAGTSSHYALLKILDDNGLVPGKDVTIILMEVDKARVAFEEDKGEGKNSIDAWAVWPPFVEQQLVTGHAKTLEGSHAYITSVGSMPISFTESNPEVADTLVNIINRAKNWIVDNREAAQHITAEQLGLDIDIVKLAWDKFNWKATFNSEILEDMQNKAMFLSEQGLTRNNILVNVKNDLISERLKK